MSRHINKRYRTSHSRLMTALRDRGYRVTDSRRAIANLLEQKHYSFTIEALSKELPSIDRATLYRTVKLFLEMGMLCRLVMMDGNYAYSLPWVDHHHHHSVCVECGSVEEFRADAVERILNNISTEIPGQVVDHLLDLYVRCGHCLADERM